MIKNIIIYDTIKLTIKKFMIDNRQEWSATGYTTC